MIEKFFKNPLVPAVASVLTLVVLLLWVYDEKTNPNKNFYGLLKPKAPII